MVVRGVIFSPEHTADQDVRVMFGGSTVEKPPGALSLRPWDELQPADAFSKTVKVYFWNGRNSRKELWTTGFIMLNNWKEGHCKKTIDVIYNGWWCLWSKLVLTWLWLSFLLLPRPEKGWTQHWRSHKCLQANTQRARVSTHCSESIGLHLTTELISCCTAWPNSNTTVIVIPLVKTLR